MGDITSDDYIKTGNNQTHQNNRQSQIAPTSYHPLTALRPTGLAATGLYGMDTCADTKKNPQQAEANGNDEAVLNAHEHDYSMW
jgi:hypothetical protein